jgi:hypothetical protein
MFGKYVYICGAHPLVLTFGTVSVYKNKCVGSSKKQTEMA